MIRIVTRIWIILTMCFWAVLVAFAVGMASETSQATGQSPPIKQRRDHPQTTVDEVSKSVMCPTCDSTLDQSDSPAAEGMRAWISEAVAAGWTKQEIRAGLVDEYDGDESILAVPRRKGVGLGVWIGPALIITLTIAVGLVLPRRWRRHRANEPQNQ